MRPRPKQKQHAKSRTSKYLPIPKAFLAVFIGAFIVMSPVFAQFQFPNRPTPPRIGGGSDFMVDNVQPNPPIIANGCRQGLNIAFAVDNSDTMYKSLGFVREDLKQFVAQIAGPNGVLTDSIKISMIFFGGRNPSFGIPAGTPLTNRTADVEAAINRYTMTRTGTDSSKGLLAAYDTVKNEPRSTPRLLIMMTDGHATDGMQASVDAANMIKSNGVRIMAIGVEHAIGGRSNFAPGSQWYAYLFNITSGRASTTQGAYPDFFIANPQDSLGTELKKIAQGVCAGPGTGNGGNGNGIGGDGNGIGNNGTGIGQTGTGQGVSPQSPAPSPNPAPAPSAKPSPNPQPNPAPTPIAQGIAPTPPPQPPSPFYDGKEYAPGSNPATFAKATLASPNLLFWLGGIAIAVAIAGIGGGWLWMYGKKPRK